jgi:short repeat uncharacterized protein DUF308
LPCCSGRGHDILLAGPDRTGSSLFHRGMGHPHRCGRDPRCYSPAKNYCEEWLFVLSGVLSVLLGMLLIASPVAGALGMIWLIATYAVAFGFMFIALGWRMRKLDPTTPGV